MDDNQKKGLVLLFGTVAVDPTNPQFAEAAAQVAPHRRADRDPGGPGGCSLRAVDEPVLPAACA